MGPDTRSKGSRNGACIRCMLTIDVGLERLIMSSTENSRYYWWRGGQKGKNVMAEHHALHGYSTARGG